MATLDYVDDWAARLRSRLYTQFRAATTWQQWCDEVLGPQFQDLEDAGQTLLTMLDVEASEGAQLDVIGRIVGQPRNGVDDDTYRLYLSARVLANKSTGTVEDIFKIMRALYGDSAAPSYAAGWVKQFAIRIGEVLTRAEALIGAEFLGDAKEAGARAILEWQESASSSMFYFLGSPVLTVAIPAGVGPAHINVTSTAGFPSSGSVIIDQGLSTQETLNYSSIVSETKLFNTSAVITQNHVIGAIVRPSGLTLDTGLGFDVGYFAGAKVA